MSEDKSTMVLGEDKDICLLNVLDMNTDEIIIFVFDMSMNQW